MALSTAKWASAQEGEAMVRVAHPSPDTAVDVYINDEPIDDPSSSPFKTVTDYAPLATGTQNIKIYASGDTSIPLLDADADLRGNAAYTVGVVGLAADSSFAPQIYEDDISPPARGKTRLRVIHAVTDLAEVDISSSEGTSLFTDLGLPNATGYVQVSAGTYAFEARPAGKGAVAFAVPDGTSSPGLELCPVWGPILGETCEGANPFPLTLADAVRCRKRSTRTRHTGRILRQVGRPDRSSSATRYPALMGKLYAVTARRTGSRVVVDSTKTSSGAALLLMMDHLSAYILHLVRDLWATTHPWSKRKVKGFSDYREPLMEQGVLNSSLQWLGYDLLAERVCRRRGGAWLRLRYEDLAGHPQARANALVVCLGVQTGRDPFEQPDPAQLPTATSSPATPTGSTPGPNASVPTTAGSKQ